MMAKNANIRKYFFIFFILEINPADLKPNIRLRNKQRKGLFEIDPLGGLRESFTRFSDNLYEKTDFRLGSAIHHVFQWVDPSVTDTPDYATASDFDINGDWKLFKKGDDQLPYVRPD